MAALALAAAMLAAPASAFAAYQASVYSNVTAFSRACIGFDDTYPEKMRKAALATYAALGFATTSYNGTGFSRSNVLARTPADWAVYVHSHGDYYGGKPGFRVDGGMCSGAPTVVSSDIAARRPSTQQTNLVVMSTCHLGESMAQNDMPLVYGIEKLKAGSGAWRGPEFYLGYIGNTWDSDEWAFETIFWDRLRGGASVGKAFDVAMATGSYHSGFDADWWGSYTYLGWPGPYRSCTNCV